MRAGVRHRPARNGYHRHHDLGGTRRDNRTLEGSYPAYVLHRIVSTTSTSLGNSIYSLYKNQPVFGQVDLELRSQGFLPHSFPAVKRWAIAPTVFGGNFRIGRNQLLKADIV
jgi:hypothetical protein